MTDSIIKTKNGSVFQIGDHNKRVYIMKMGDKEPTSWIDEIIRLAQKQGCDKVFCKIDVAKLPIFLMRGFVIEAFIPNYFKGRDAFFVSRFFNHRDRFSLAERASMNELSIPLSSLLLAPINSSNSFEVVELSMHDAVQMADLFKMVFESYPFPVYDPQYLIDTMRSHITYFGVKVKGRLVAMASAEVDQENNAAEMTDFAIHSEYRGLRLSERLLVEMEHWAKRSGLSVLFTIARLNSLPMNKTFIRQGYKFSGTLINNTNIAGSIESMNVYYKAIE